ncbi:unnamed protein product, partial [Durusdinium trenchii]
MPPRKKAKSLAAGVSTPQNITTADAMPSFQKDVLSICESIFELRHGRVSDVHEKPIGLLVPEHGLFAWPICYGGTFKDIAQRCWEDGGDKLLKMSAELCNRLGLVDSADVDDFKTNFCRIDVWPPQRGDNFETSILSWSFEDASFWRGNSISMAEVMTFVRSIASSRFREGETITLRMPCAPLQSGNLALGCLYFSDGSQKSLAGFITWVSMCLASQLEKHQGTLADNVHLQTSAASLLRIQTTVKGSTGSSDELDNTIARIVKQNVDAKVMPVSSLTWVTVLRSLTSEPTGFDAAMAKYNSHPEVVSFDSGSSGAISLDNRKKQAVKNLLEATDAQAFEELVRSARDIPFQYGAFGEGFCCSPGLWLNSCGRLDPCPEQDPELAKQLSPLPHEPFVTLDWKLPLDAQGQLILFRRVKFTFERVTGLIPLHQKRKYRMNSEELNRVRNMVALFSQILPHLRARLGDDDANKWQVDVETGMGRDDDILNLMQLRPTVFSLSMLLSHQRQAKEDMRESEKRKVETVETQRKEVLTAQWNYFLAALERDYAQMEQVHAAPAQVRQRLHVKQVAHQAKIVAADHCQVPLDRVATVGFVDYNVPVARQSKAAQTLVSAMSIANDTGAPTATLPKSNMLLLPEGASPNSDLKIAERVRPSPEQSSAQKGLQRLEILVDSLVRYVPLKDSPLLIVNFTGYVEELAAAVLNLRIRGSLSGDGGGFDYDRNLYYLSLHTLDSDSGVAYAQGRELKNIPGAQFLKAIDKMNLEVCVRKGTQMVLHPDQVKQWNNSGVEYAEQFAEVQKKHDSKYLGLLTSIISQPQGSSSQLAAAAPADMDEGATAGSGATEEPIQELNKFESVEKLAEAEKIEYRCMSEVAGIELLLCESKKIFLVADKDRIVAKWTMVGGFGTGKQFGLKSKYVAINESAGAGVPIEWPQGDRTLVQIDHSSISPEHSHVEVMSLYRLLTHLERTKKVSNHKVSYTEVKRVVDGGSAGAADAFTVKVSDPHQYHCLSDVSRATTCKNCFAQTIGAIRSSTYLTPVFRW